MAQFTDAHDRVWDLEITGATIKLARKLLDIDLGNLFEGTPPLLTRLSTDIAFLVDVIYIICKPQADKLEIDDVAFAGGLGGEALRRADEALAKSLVFFYQSLGRGAMVSAIQKQRTIIQHADEKIGNAINGEELDGIIDGIIDKTLADLKDIHGK